MSRFKEKKRDDRDFDTTSLHENYSRDTLSRDYSAHFFRWSFARRLIKGTDDVLEVGCGPERPLSKLLTIGLQPKCKTYTGVDINKLKPSGIERINLIGEFNFVQNWKRLVADQKAKKLPRFTVAVNMEVIEHMKVEHGRNMLKGIHALLVDGGTLLLSTPCYDGKRHAANHIHEYTVPELAKMVKACGFEVEQRFGTFMDIKHIGKDRATNPNKGEVNDMVLTDSVAHVKKALSAYFDNDAISNFFGPLYPDHARNNLWVLKKV